MQNKRALEELRAIAKLRPGRDLVVFSLCPSMSIRKSDHGRRREP
jgi:hypothetical protein